jgi:hypothetical protein
VTSNEAEAIIYELVKDGWLLGVGTFTGEGCCVHPYDDDCPNAGVGLCDNMNPHSPGGSDCNRAAPWLMRPNDAVASERIALEIAESSAPQVPGD